ncbi:hypothetical protein [Granulicella sp. L46]|uniref:hypothetical protein n=1 Tax=Granulicella sp. L46 TaxID=1641865 RepID=UPI00131AE066|nr:hypothetical protein [Granulicella sp. L46]
MRPIGFWLSVSVVMTACAGCGGGGTQKVTTSETTLTIARLDPSLPAAVQGLITKVVSVADSEPPATALKIPAGIAGVSSLIFAVDQNQNPILAAFANADTTVLSVDSTSVALVLSSLDPSSSSVLTYSQMEADVQNAAGYSALSAAVLFSLQSGTAPVTSSSVLGDVAIVVNQVIPVVLSQIATAETPSANTVRSSLSPAEIAGPPLPFQILGPIASLATFYSVYINAPDGNGGVEITNKLPIALHAYSADLSGNNIVGPNPGLSLPAAPPLFAYPQTATAVDVGGNGQQFLVTVDQNSAARDANVRQGIANVLIFIMNQALGKVATGVNVDACAQQGVTQLINGMGTAYNTVILSASTGAGVDLSLANNLTVASLGGAFKIAFSCAAKASTTSIFSTIATWLNPYNKWLQLLSLTAQALPTATQLSLTIYYWNLVQPVQVCESGNQVVACTQPLYGIEQSQAGTPTIVSLNPSSGTVSSLYAFPSNFYTGLSEGALDPLGHRYFQIVETDSGTASTQQLYTVDVTGASSPSVTQLPNLPAMWGLQFDASSGLLYGTEALGSGVPLVSLNPSTGAIESMYTFPITFYIVYAQGAVDSVGQRYFQIGMTGANSFQLYNIDLTGSAAPQVVSAPQIYNLVFDSSSGLLYGIEILPGDSYALVSLDPSSGSVGTIYSFPASSYPGLYDGALDPIEHQYFQIVTGQNSSQEQLYTIDLTGGTPTTVTNVPAILDLSY